MRTTLGQDVAGIASGLNDDVIHVWLLSYRKSEHRAPLRALLGVYLGLPADAVMLVEGEHGRPELAAPWNRSLQFNWSHSGDKAVIAIALDVVPGIDLEQVRPRPRAMELAQRFFHPTEVTALNALEQGLRERAFLQLWTAKEAVLKALGRGIAFGLHRLCVATAPEISALLWLEDDDASQWRLHPLELGADYLASVAWRGPPRSVSCWTLAENG
jgi:4'-phosphopantetheinyl transferase